MSRRSVASDTGVTAPPEASTAEPGPALLRRHLPDVLASGWFLLVGLAFMAPTIIHGSGFAPFDLLNFFGLGHHSAYIVHNSVDSDLIQQDVPWLKLDWMQVHHGQLPLWNPYSGEGMPLALDFSSATFSLPTIVSFAFPVQAGLLVSVLVKLLIAGTGAYLFGRVIGLSRLSSIMVGTVFELSGAFTVWLGWSQSGVMAWAGWLFAAVFLVVKGDHRVRSTVLLALVFACSALGGHPESTVILTMAVAVFVAVLLIGGSPRFAGPGRSGRRSADLALGVGAGACLSAPLWLPGLELSTATTRFQSVSLHALPASNLLNFVFQGFDGLPIGNAGYVNPSNYYEVTAFVGIVALALAAFALLERWRQHSVIALSAGVVTMLALTFVQPILSLVDILPHASGINWHRGLIPISLCLAALAGVGLDALLANGAARAAQHKLGGIFGVFAIGLAALGGSVAATGHGLPPVVAGLREKSFFWPAVSTAAGLAVVAVLIVVRRRSDRLSGPSDVHRAGAHLGHPRLLPSCAVALVVVETMFLVLAGGPLWTAGQPYFAVTPGEMALQKAVGSSTVGFGTCPSVATFPSLGILPEANVAYAVHEIGFFDTAIAPEAYYSSWGQATGSVVQPVTVGSFCPAMTTVGLARRYGVTYVLEPPGKPGPKGSVFRGLIEDEGLYFVPGASAATLAPGAAPRQGQRGVSGAGTPVQVSHPDDATWRMVVDGPRTSTLYLRLTAVPGWRGTVDGRPVPLRTWDSVLLKLTVPAGRHVVLVTYWPAAFQLGLVIAAVTATAIAVAVIVAATRRYRSRPSVHAGARP